MNYNLNELSAQQQKNSTLKALGKLLQLITEERKNLYLALAAILTNSTLNLLGPLIVGYTLQHYIYKPETRDYNQVLLYSGLLLGMYVIAFFASYMQTMTMGGVGQRMLYKLRNSIFTKLQQLPVGFFNQNKAGDLISRVNNDTDKINQFFSQSLMQFIGTIVTMTGAGIFLLIINIKLGLATLAPGLFIFLFTRATSAWVKKKNAVNLKSTGSLSAEIQESLNNFKVIIAFNRRDYFRKRFDGANKQNYTTAVSAGLANNIFLPIYGLFASIAQLIVLVYGVHLISLHEFNIGYLVAYLAYATQFYNPLRQLAALWANFQVAMAGWDRISVILSLESNLPVIAAKTIGKSNVLMTFNNVYFGYTDDKEILHNISFDLERGKTYALVGPTGGGKTTTASLIARLYDPVSGEVLLGGKDIRAYEPEERAEKIGFILQEPFLFTGTVRENILYGNTKYKDYTKSQLEEVIKEDNLEALLAIFDKGLETPVASSGDTISLGQKQLIAFMRAVLRHPDILILDEATANIDTITEQILEEILNRLPETTTRVIIAHRLNTIQNADEIFFVNAGEVVRAGSFDHAVNMLMHGKRAS
ncbi:MAG TPA: ABC transporter ATP-binding protein [Chitinophagaceae bacterium]|nr:ABC transporter ATP-binding protein [Chitinophagaceae bacterium]